MSIRGKDLAEMLNLSPATISMVLRGKPGISDETRKRVLAAASEMGYAKGILSEKDRRPRLQLVLYKRHGSVVSDTEFFSQLTQSIELESKRRGYDLLVTYFYGNQDSKEQMQSLQSTFCEGMILLATEMQTTDIQPFKELTMPMIILDRYFPDEDYDCVSINNVYGAKHAVQHLIQQGHSEIGYLSSSVPIRNFHERQDGYLRGIKSIQVLNNSRRHWVKISPTIQQAYLDMMTHLSSRPHLPTAFFADNDLIAISCMKALRAFGYRIPEDISIIGFDGISAGELLDTPLTTMNVSKEQLGISAVTRLLERIDGLTRGTVKIEISTQLLERSSVQKREEGIL